jgi:hypothetical protein
VAVLLLLAVTLLRLLVTCGMSLLRRPSRKRRSCRSSGKRRSR